MSYIKVEGHTSLVRERVSNGIVNTDKNAYSIYMQRVREARKSNNDLRYAVREINNLKAELSEIKELLGKLVK
jgi:hypothetical protein|tara:strand:- start:2473 stop:2691 length:219 start_codon:yes stop_codon:yes gene_type:complete